jgi:hypothetical protein
MAITSASFMRRSLEHLLKNTFLLMQDRKKKNWQKFGTRKTTSSWNQRKEAQ